MKTICLKILPLLFLVAWAGFLHAQTIGTTAGSVTSCPGAIVVPVTVTNCNGVGAISLMFTFDTTKLTYTGYQNVNSYLSANGLLFINRSGNKVIFGWANTVAANLGNTSLFEVKFNAVSSTTTLAWDTQTPGSCEYTNVSGTVLAASFTNGTATIQYPPAITVQPSNRIIPAGQNTTFSVTATGTGLTYQWQVSTNNGVNYTDLTNTAPYSNVTAATMNITNPTLAMSGNMYRCIVTGTCTPSVTSNGARLLVFPNVVTNCGSATSCPGQIIIPITVTDFTSVAAFSMALNYNTSVLTYTGYQNRNTALNPGLFSANASGGKVYLGWSNTSGVTIPTSGTLIELKFTALPGASPLTWDTQTPGNCEYVSEKGERFFYTWNNGNTTIHSPPSVTSHPVDQTIYGSGSTSFSITATGTGLTYLWQVSTNGGGSWTNLSNTSPYSGATSPTLSINPVTEAMNGYLYHCNVTGTCTPPVTSNAAQLTVTQTAIYMTMGGVTNSCTGNLSLPVSVANCNNVASISLTLNFDTTKLTFEGYESVHAGLANGLVIVNRAANQVIMSWVSTTPVSIGSVVLLKYRFKGNAGISTTLSWDYQTAGACEFTTLAGTIIPSFYTSGSVAVRSNALIISAGTDLSTTGPPVQLNGTATGGSTPYTWAWAPAASLNNPAIANPVASPTVTTTYSVTVTDNAACAAIDEMVVNVGPLSPDIILRDIIIPNGTNQCYNATQTITVAGNGRDFLVQSGGSATLIAGNKITFLDGTRVLPGGYLNAYITTNGQYCTAVPVNRTLMNLDIQDGASTCYDATQQIRVAGGGSTFLVRDGGSAIMIAGSKINFYYGTRVYAGGYLHGYITTGAQYCSSLPQAPGSEENSETMTTVPDGGFFMVYPNPTTGKFIISFKDDDMFAAPMDLTIYRFTGELVYRERLDNAMKLERSLAGQASGIYFVRITDGTRNQTWKLIRQ